MSQTEMNDSKFAIGKYNINTMEMIKICSINMFMLVSDFPWLTIFFSQKEALLDLRPTQGVIH